LKQQHAELVSQHGGAAQEFGRFRPGVFQALLVSDAARRLERESEVVGHLLRPAREHGFSRHAVKRVVDLDRRETFRVVAQHLARGQLLRVERAQPLLVGIAAGSR